MKHRFGQFFLDELARAVPGTSNAGQASGTFRGGLLRHPGSMALFTLPSSTTPYVSSFSAGGSGLWPFPSPTARSSGLVAGAGLYRHPLLLQPHTSTCSFQQQLQTGRELKSTFQSVTTQTTSFHSLIPQNLNLKMLHKTL